MRTILVLAVLALVSVSTAAAAEEKDLSPLQKAKVGDFVEFKASVSGFGGGQTMYLRYTVKEKTDTDVTLEMKSFVGENEMGQREIKIPLEAPLDLTSLTPSTDDKIEVKLDKKIPNLKYKVGTKQFEGTAYSYKMNVDLFGGLGLGDKKEEDKKKEDDKPDGKLAMTLSYFVSPEAPVLGIVAIAMKGLVPVRYELSDGTGVGDLLYPPVKTPSPNEKTGKGDWVEYHGTNKPDDRKIVLRHELKEKQDDKMIVACELLVDGEKVEAWDMELPRKKAHDVVPVWSELGKVHAPSSFQNFPGTRTRQVTILGDKTIDAQSDTFSLLLVEGNERPHVDVTLYMNSKLPLTTIAEMKLKRHPKVDVTLTLAKHSGIVDIKTETKKTTAKGSTSKSSEKSKSKSSSKSKTKAKR